ncbi:MAG: PAS domain S-box protein, partial [Bacteroidota bacterium]
MLIMDYYKEKYDSLKSVMQFANESFTNKVSCNEFISRLNAETYILTKCRAAALYIMDTSTFEFNLTGNYSSVKTIEANRAFDILIENGVVSDVLLNGENAVMQISDYDTAYLLPLKSNNTVYSLQLLIAYNNNRIDVERISLLSTLNSIFTFLFYDNLNRPEAAYNRTKDNYDLINQIEHLKKGAEELHHIIDTIQEGILIIDKTTNQIRDVNQTALNLISSSKESLIGKTKDDFFLFFDNKMFKGEIITKEEVLLIDASGNVIPILYAAKDIALGEYEYQIISFIDISERKMMEDKILQSRFELELQVEERTRELVIINNELQEQIIEREKAEQENFKLHEAIEQTESLITITGLDYKIEYVNSALLKKTGYELEELISKTPVIFKAKRLDYDAYKESHSAVKNGTQWHGEHYMRKKNGEIFWVSTHISPIRNQASEIIKYMGVQEDITERKKAELELKLAKEKIEKAEKAKTTLLANMSHEFRTPLISILGFSELLDDELTDLEQKKMVYAIQSGGKRLLNSLESVLTLSHLESSNLTFVMKEVNLIPLIYNAIEILIPEAKEKCLDISFENSLDEINVATEESFLTQTIN